MFSSLNTLLAHYISLESVTRNHCQTIDTGKGRVGGIRVNAYIRISVRIIYTRSPMNDFRMRQRCLETRFVSNASLATHVPPQFCYAAIETAAIFGARHAC